MKNLSNSKILLLCLTGALPFLLALVWFGGRGVLMLDAAFDVNDVNEFLDQNPDKIASTLNPATQECLTKLAGRTPPESFSAYAYQFITPVVRSTGHRRSNEKLNEELLKVHEAHKESMVALPRADFTTFMPLLFDRQTELLTCIVRKADESIAS
jgi:hypothetical protein